MLQDKKIERFFPTIDKIIEIMWWNDWSCNAILLSTFSNPDLVEIVNGFIYETKRNINFA